MKTYNKWIIWKDLQYNCTYKELWNTLYFFWAEESKIKSCLMSLPTCDFAHDSWNQSIYKPSNFCHLDCRLRSLNWCWNLIPLNFHSRVNIHVYMYIIICFTLRCIFDIHSQQRKEKLNQKFLEAYKAQPKTGSEPDWSLSGVLFVIFWIIATSIITLVHVYEN